MSAQPGMHQSPALGGTARATGHGMRRSNLARWAGTNSVLGLLVVLLLGLGFAWWLYGYPMLRGTAPFWWRDNADISQYLSGFNAFVHEPWHWPLLRLESMNVPNGTLVTFLDAVPGYALLLKLVHPGKGYWNPYGFWLALCFMLQGVGAWWICREAKVQRWPVLVALTLLLLSFPEFTLRFGHISLMAQWLLLFALAVYLRSGRLGRLAVVPWTILLIGTFYLNIYLFAMSSAIFAADILREALRAPLHTPQGRASLRRAAAAPLIAYGLMFASMWITMLPMPPGAGNPEWGFGYYSMNLLAPLHGGGLLHLENPIAQDGGQAEGFNYLGIFLLALTAWVYKLRQRRDPAFWRRHRALLVILIVLTLYALSNIVYFGSVRVYTLDLPSQLSKVTTSFRVSGRFFWPVGYAIVLFTVLGVARYVKGWRGAALLAAVVVLQFWDLRAHHATVRALAAESSPAKIDAARWDAFLGKDINTLYYYPPFRCGKTPATDALLPTMIYAVQHGIPMSTGYIARSAKPCTGYDVEIGSLPASTAVAFEKQEFPLLEDVQKLMGSNANCADMNIVFLCRRNSTPLNIDTK
jgi:hypothetical protein